MPNTKHVIHQPRPLRRAIITLISLIVASSLLWLYLDSTSHQAREQFATLKSEHQSRMKEHQVLQQQYELASKKLVALEQSFIIQHETNKQLALQISELHNEIVGLNRELNFYQNITQGTGSSELQIRDFYLSPAPLDNALFNYRIVITQGKKISNAITGTVSLMLKDKDSKTIKHDRVLQHKLKLRQVQVLDGQIKLTDSAKPNKITVTLKRNKKKSLSKDFNWLPKPVHSL